MWMEVPLQRHIVIARDRDVNDLFFHRNEVEKRDSLREVPFFSTFKGTDMRVLSLSHFTPPTILRRAR